MDPNTAEAKHLLAFIERIERLEEDKKQVAEDIKDVYAEARGTGYDTKTIRKIVAIRKQDADKRREEEEMLDLYMSALGMLADTPLGEAAVARDLSTKKPLNPTTAMREQQAEDERLRAEKMAADVVRRKAEADAEAERLEVRRKKAEAALRAGYIEDARKAGFDAYDGDEWSEPEAYKGDEEALAAHRDGWHGCAEQAAKFKGSKRAGGDQPSAGAPQ